jgi:hypothetical protein
MKNNYLSRLPPPVQMYKSSLPFEGEGFGAGVKITYFHFSWFLTLLATG